MTENLVVVDVETTGIYPHENSIVSIGAVRVSDPSNVFYDMCRIWSDAKVDAKALEVNGMTHEEIKSEERQTEAELIQKFIDWCPERPLMIAHNASFDRDFVSEAAKRAGIDSPFGIRTIDIHSIVAMHLLRQGKPLPRRLSLDVCLKSLGLPPEPTPHNALVGARCEAQLFDAVMNYQEGDQDTSLFNA